jgi:hypothetical protein
MDVEAGVERLYGLAPEEFVAARDELARQLRKDGDATAAKRVAGLRRPTVAAWAVNQAARRRPELVTDLIEAGERLRQAQRRALSGLRGGGLRAAGAERRVAVERLLAEATEVLEQSGRSPEAHRDAIAATLQAASVDEKAAAVIRAGTLHRELAAPSGFGEVAGLELVQPLAPEPAAPERPAKPARRRPKLDPARRRELDAARRQRDQRWREARAAAKAAAKAREAADQAAEAEVEATEAARRLAGEATQARRTAEEARRAADEARRVADEAREAAETAKTRSQRAARRARDVAEEAIDADTAAGTARNALERAERRVTELESGD